MNSRHQKIGRLVEEFKVLECMRRQTAALNSYLEAVKKKQVNGDHAVELYLAHAEAKKALLGFLGVLPGQEFAESVERCDEP